MLGEVTLITKAVSAMALFKTGNTTWSGVLGMPLSWQSNRGYLLLSRLRENLEHVCITLDKCGHQEAVRKGEGHGQV